ncbi:centrosomal protein of 120 kDa [Culex pipiens pallens]|uniref:centrosomal protein of 120 kDa n=1 Tax=Culex pipiens pallens TaxID=42434 RepID=UPI001953E9D5|nr:centrosomal protein of 120 kDa [Culex pipiens pallens]
MDNSSDELVVTVHILDAINFHRVKNTPIVISASLDKNVLETASRTPGIASTNFEQSLVWETDRQSVKRMKTENIPIKIECFAVEGAQRTAQALIGHLLLPLRSVPLLPSSKAATVRPRWYRLIGLNSPEWKSQKPEVQLLAVITDKGYLSLGKKKVESDSELDRSLVIFTNPEPARLNSKDDLPILLLEERGLLQVGDFETERDLFLVKIVLKYAKQLQGLIPDGIPADFRIRYELLGDSYPCTLEKKPNDRFFIQEKIVINFRTSLQSLKRYFDEVFLIRLEILNGEQVVGLLNLSFGDLIKDGSLDEFLRRQQESTAALEVEKYYPIEPQLDPSIKEKLTEEHCAVIKCKFTLKYLSTDYQQESTKAKEHVTQEKDSRQEVAESQPSIQSINLHKPLEPPPVEPPKKIDIQSILQCEDRDMRDVPRTFSYNLLLQSIRFNARPSSGIWQLSLFHPKADTPLTKITMELTTIESDTLEFPNLQLSLYFSTLPDHVLETITAERSKLSLHAPHGLAGYARLDNQSLVVGTKERRSGVVILENQNGESIGMATVFCFLDEVGVNYNSRDPDHDPPEVATLSSRGRLHDQLSYKMLEEQKQWMLTQRELFLAELKRKEAAHLTRLSSEWKKKRCKENEAIARKLEHASALTAALEETKKNIHVRSVQQSCQSESLEEVKTKLELQYQQQLTEIRDKTTRLETDLKHRSKLQDLRCNELEERNDALTDENQQLKQQNARLTQELESAKKSIQDSQNQRTAIESRIEEAEKSKLFYKQQWAKMIREVHKMKLDNEEQLGELLRGRERKKKGHSSSVDATAGCCFRSTVEAGEQQKLDRIRSMIFDEPGCCLRSDRF